jgi:hypothetical protein
VIRAHLFAALVGLSILAIVAVNGCVEGGGGSSSGGDGGNGDGGNRLESSTPSAVKTRFVEPNVVKEDTAAWTGQSIKIQIEGVGVAVNGGVQVTADPNATKVSATARILAMASEDDKANADQSILDAKGTFTITSSGTDIVVACGHGGSHGSSNAGESGCELVQVTLPTGSTSKPLKLEILGGNGEMMVQLRGATIANVGVNNNGSGDTSAEVPATPGANVSLVSSKSGDITVTLPTNWSADEVILQADADKIQNAFADAKLGAGAGGRGTPGVGLASLKVTSKEFAGSTGTITLR